MIPSPPAQCPVDAESRAFTDAALTELRASGWKPMGWVRFLARTTARSAEQVGGHPRAAIEVTCLHGAFYLAGRGRGRWWITSSLAMALGHLGMVGPRRSIGWANAVTLARANMPVCGLGLGRWLGLVALASDKLDGTIARRSEPTMFGFYADSLADAAFWTWFGGRLKGGALPQAAILAAWALPVGAVGAASIAKGQMVESPRPALVRPAAAMQAVLAAWAFWKGAPTGPPRAGRPS